MNHEGLKGHRIPKPMTRKGKPCKVLPDGATRRMSDGKNAYRKMNTDQRATFKLWMAEQDQA